MGTAVKRIYGRAVYRTKSPLHPVMTRNFNTNTQNNDEWLTPPLIIESLGPFDLDPCSPIIRPWDTARVHYNRTDNGLIKPWFGRVWLNPPYGRHIADWLSRLANHGNGIALIFARTETKGFHEQIWNKAHAVFFFAGRLSFHTVTGERAGTANAPSVLVAYGDENVAVLENKASTKELKGKFIGLK